MKFIIINNKKHIVKTIKHKNGTDTITVIPYNEKKYNKILNEVVDKLENVTNKREILKQALMSIEYDGLLSFHKTLVIKKKKPVAKKGCYEIKIGKEYLEIVS